MHLVQELEPSGVGARDIKECFLIQIRQSPDDLGIEAELVSKHIWQRPESSLYHPTGVTIRA